MDIYERQSVEAKPNRTIIVFLILVWKINLCKITRNILCLEAKPLGRKYNEHTHSKEHINFVILWKNTPSKHIRKKTNRNVLW